MSKVFTYHLPSYLATSWYEYYICQCDIINGLSHACKFPQSATECQSNLWSAALHHVESIKENRRVLACIGINCKLCDLRNSWLQCQDMASAPKSLFNRTFNRTFALSSSIIFNSPWSHCLVRHESSWKHGYGYT